MTRQSASTKKPAAAKAKKLRTKGEKESAGRIYTARTLKLLWGRSAGRCAMPECREQVFVDATDYDPIVTIGDIAHVAASSDDGPRADGSMTQKQRDDYSNLIVLCKNCHTRIDGQKVFYSKEKILDIKQRHEEWVRKSLPARGQSTTGWSVVVLEGDHPLDLGTATDALSPDFQHGEALKLKVPSDTSNWAAVDDKISLATASLLVGSDSFDHRVAVFPLAPVSACIALGYHLTSRPNVRLHQNHRDTRNWRWPDRPAPVPDIKLVERDGDAASEAVGFLFSLSAAIQEPSVGGYLGHGSSRFDISVPAPSVEWLVHPDQVIAAAASARQAFQLAVEKYPRAKLWHLFFAGPAPIAVAVGQQLNPTMFPHTQLYEFRYKETPQYRPSILLK